MYERNPGIAAEWRRALAENDAESLSILINRRLHSEEIAIGDTNAINAVVAALAPSWNYVDATTKDANRPRIELTTKEPA